MLSSLSLLALSVALVSFTFAPYGQFYLAWIGLVPWLMVVRRARSFTRAALWGWLGGAAFFAVNLAWVARATAAGYIGLSIYLGVFWALAAVLIRGVMPQRDLSSQASIPSIGRAVAIVLLVPAIWAATEWLRAVTPVTGFPWLLLGHSQSPLQVTCQIADATGVYGISFWIVAVNAAIFVAIDARRHFAPLVSAAATAIGLVGIVIGYGAFRLAQDTTRPGPRILLVQPNHLHERGGRSPVTQEQQIEFHLRVTREALQRDRPDLVVWSETVMPGLNPEARDEPGLAAAPFLRSLHATLGALAREHATNLLTGGYYVGGWEGTLGKRRATDIRNSVYLYERDGAQSAKRYDKIHLLAFGEYLPFKQSAPILYKLLRYFAAYSVDYPIIAAPPDAMTLFEFETGDGSPVRLVTPICFEDVNARLLSRMFAGKRADMIVNVTNDGWFVGNLQAQHFQAATFRSIECRAPTARASNTGISGFIDSSGRSERAWQIPARTEGTLAGRVAIDWRVAPYTRIGDAFAYACIITTFVATTMRIVRRRRSDGTPPA